MDVVVENWFRERSALHHKNRNIDGNEGSENEPKVKTSFISSLSKVYEKWKHDVKTHFVSNTPSGPGYSAALSYETEKAGIVIKKDSPRWVNVS